MKQLIGTKRIADYEQYSILLQTALDTHAPIITNNFPIMDQAKSLISSGRLFFAAQPKYTLFFQIFDGFVKLYFIAAQDAVLHMPKMQQMLVADLEQHSDNPQTEVSAMLERSGFTLRRENTGMEQDFTTPSALAAAKIAAPALPAAADETERIDTLFRQSFDPILDQLPSAQELLQYQRQGHVYVLREQDKIIAASVCIPKGNTLLLRWVAIDKAYRHRGLGKQMNGFDIQNGLNHHCIRGFCWVNAASTRWLQSVAENGFHQTQKQLYSYCLDPV